MARRGDLRFSHTAKRPAVRLFSALVVLGLLALVIALISQHAFGMEPCPWCVLDRLVFVAIAIAGVLGLAWRSLLGTRVAATLALLLSIAGMTATVWQHFVAAKADSCNLTLADRIVGASTLDALLPDVFAPRASCADAAVNLLGVPYDFWALAAFAVCAVLMVRALRLAA